MPLKLVSSTWYWDWLWDWDCQSKNLVRRGHAAQIGMFHLGLGLGLGLGIGILSEVVGKKNLAQSGKFKGLGLIFNWGLYQRSCLAKEP